MNDSTNRTGAIFLENTAVPYSVDVPSSRLFIGGSPLPLNNLAGAAITLPPNPAEGRTVSHAFQIYVVPTSLSVTGLELLVDGTATRLPAPSTTTSSTLPPSKVTSVAPSSTPITSSGRSENSMQAATTTSRSSTKSVTSTQASGSSSSPSSNPSHEPSSSSNGLSKGAAAGIGVGCAIAGAVIAACIVFLLMRKRRKSRPSRSYPLEEKPATLPKQANGSAKPTNAASSVFAVAETSLPLPLEDAAIGGEMSRLQTLIKNYAQSYHHNSPVTSKSPDLSGLGPHLSIPAATLAAMLSDPRTRLAAIRYCVAWTIFSRIGLNCDVGMSLLPAEVASCTRAMSADTASRGFAPSMASWRALTHSLLSSTYPASSSTPLNPASLQAAVSTLDIILQHYADTSHDSYERMTKLEEVIKRGSRFGWTLFGQVSSFDFDWERRTRGEVGIFPALLQTVNERGEKLSGRGRVLWEGEGTRVEGM